MDAGLRRSDIPAGGPEVGPNVKRSCSGLRVIASCRPERCHRLNRADCQVLHRCARIGGPVCLHELQVAAEASLARREMLSRWLARLDPTLMPGNRLVRLDPAPPRPPQLGLPGGCHRASRMQAG